MTPALVLVPVAVALYLLHRANRKEPPHDCGTEMCDECIGYWAVK